MTWTDPAHVLQAIFWVCMFFAFAHGFNAGNRM